MKIEWLRCVSFLALLPLMWPYSGVHRFVLLLGVNLSYKWV